MKTKYLTENEATEQGNYFHHFNTEEKYFLDINEKMRKCQKVSKWGCGISVRKREKKEWRYIDTGTDRFSAVVWDDKVLVICLYFPCNHNTRQSDELLADVIQELLVFVKTNSQSLELLLCGDFNIGEKHGKFRQEQKQLLKDTLELEEVKPSGPTNFHYTGAESCLDYCLHTSGIRVENMSRILDLAGNMSTHVPITFSIVYRKEVEKKKVEKKVERDKDTNKQRDEEGRRRKNIK